MSALIGAVCGLVGMYLSYAAEVPSGTMIVLAAVAVFSAAFGFSNGRRRRRSLATVDVG